MIWLLLFLLPHTVFSARQAQAAILGQFSLSAGEEYNDNIFFAQKREHDFISSLTPTFSILYVPPSGTVPTLTASLSAPAQFFARHRELNNFGDNIVFDSRYTHFYSPALTLSFSESVRRTGTSRTGDGGGGGTGGAAPPPPIPGGPPPSVTGGVADLVTTGARLSNSFSAMAAYRYAPNITFNGTYSNNATFFITEGGSETNHSVGVRGVYNWREAHNLHLGYTATFRSPRQNGTTTGSSTSGGGANQSNVIHNLDVGDDYFSIYKIEADPTVTITARSGLSFNTSNDGPRIVNSSDIKATKVWEAATLSAGLVKGLTDSMGVAGLSLTTTYYGDFILRLTEYLTSTVSLSYSSFDTDTVDFQTFQTSAGMLYQVTPWLSSNFRLSHQWRASGGTGVESSTLGTTATIRGTSVSLSFSGRFDIYPKIGLGQGVSRIPRALEPPVTQPAEGTGTPAAP